MKIALTDVRLLAVQTAVQSMVQKLTLGFVLAFGVVAPQAWAAPCDYSELSKDDLAKIDQGEVVICTVDVPKTPWPRVFGYVAVNAEVLEAIGFYSDITIQKDYLPSVKKSDQRLKTPLTWDGDYTVSVPIVGSESYTSGVTMSRDTVSGPYRLVWSKVRADSTKAFDGKAAISEYAKGRVLIAYENFIHPSQTGASLFKGKAIAQQRDIVKAIGAELSKRIRENPTYMNARVKWILDRFADQALIDWINGKKRRP